MSAYFLPRHIHFCQRGDAFVFLDLKQDDYTLVNGPAAAALKAISLGPASALHDMSNDAVSELLGGGLLVTDPTAGRIIAPTQTDAAVESLVDRESLLDARVTLANVLNFALACITAAMQLRWRPIEATVLRVARRKADGGQSIDMARARELTAAFLRLRGFFPANYLCLFDSLALLEFLARYRIFPTWVFGIRLEPWSAHCWIQHGSCAFNEEADEAANYTPIMAI